MKTVDYPRSMPDSEVQVGQIIMWPLTQNEQMASNAEADRFAKKLLRESQKKDEATLGYDSIYSNEVAVQVLYRACRDVQNYKQAAFPTPSDMREKITADEIGGLFALYCSVAAEVGPLVTRMSDEEMEAWVVALAEGGAQYPFALLSAECQQRLLSFMASRLHSFWTATPSAGSPPDEPLPQTPDGDVDAPAAT